MELKTTYRKYNFDGSFLEEKEVIFNGDNANLILFNLKDLSFALEDIKCKYDVTFPTGFVFSNVSFYKSYSEDQEEHPGLLLANKLDFINAICSHAKQILTYIYPNEVLSKN